ncbi:chaplin [Streptomyces sp. NPDC048385]|uniref:chaplin n=1 Tax=unclassified Streptomyces TaxID=2593676 RepID=UPI003444D738
MRQGTRKGLMTVAAATGVIAAASGYAHADSGAAGSAARSAGVLSGNTVQAPLHVPLNICGNTVNVVGVLNPAMGNRCGGQGGAGGSHAGGRTAGSPGVGSGNTVQAPIDVPVNVCGNSVDVVGVLNPAMGNRCGGQGGAGGSHAGGRTAGSPGVGSGNTVQAPIDVPVNVCGNSVDVIGVGNTAAGNECADNGGSGHPGHPGQPGGGHPTQPPGHGTTPPGNPGTPGQPGTPGHPGHHPGTPPAHSGNRTVPTGSHGGIVSPLGSAPVAAQLAHTGGDLPLGLVLPAGAGSLIAGAVLYRRARATA